MNVLLQINELQNDHHYKIVPLESLANELAHVLPPAERFLSSAFLSSCSIYSLPNFADLNKKENSNLLVESSQGN